MFRQNRVVSKREWNTPLREPWNPVIAHQLKAIDTHVTFYWATGDLWHLKKADELRNYVRELKDWLSEQEKITPK
jgi:hypothetical protein